MKPTTLLSACATMVLSLAAVAPASAATLIGQTIDANITITGSDDFGFYTLPVLVGPITIAGPGDFTQSIPVLKQLTFMGFSTPSNQIDGNVIIDISGDTISVEMQGQVQPFELESQFSGIAGNITAISDSATGLIPGVNLDLFSNFTPTSVDFATYYLGYQPGTDVTQTETLTFGSSVVPEPAEWALMLGGFALAGAAVRISRRWSWTASA